MGQSNPWTTLLDLEEVASFHMTDFPVGTSARYRRVRFSENSASDHHYILTTETHKHQHDRPADDRQEQAAASNRSINLIAPSHPVWDPGPTQLMVPRDHLSPCPKRYLDWFNRFSTAHGRVQQTDRHRDHATSAAIGRNYASRGQVEMTDRPKR